MRFVESFVVLTVAASALGCRGEGGVADLVRPLDDTTDKTTLGTWYRSSDTRCAPSTDSARIGVQPPGHVVYRLPDGHDYRIEARPGSAPDDLTAELDKLSPGIDGFVNVSADGQWLLVQTSRFGCGEDMCMAIVDRSACDAQVIVSGFDAVRPEATSAISEKGEVVVFPGEGVHPTDLFAVRRTDTGWTAATNLTKTSTAPYNKQPSLSADGTRVVFDCGPDPGAGPGTAICEAAVDGTSFRVAVPPTVGDATSANHHPAYAPDGSIVFEGTWNGGAEQVWRAAPGAAPALVNAEKDKNNLFRFTDDNSPCVLPDGRIVSLWLGRPASGPAKGATGHEIKMMGAHGEQPLMLVTDVDVVDIGIGCGP